MSAQSPLKPLVLFCLLCAAIIAASWFVAPLWADKPEGVAADAPELAFAPAMTVAEFGKANGLPNPSLKKIFGLKDRSELQRNVLDFGLDRETILERGGKQRALGQEYKSKNWFKIPLKFGLWFAFLGLSFYLLRKKRIDAPMRKALYLAAAILFGVILSADPSPMGTVKDAIHLYAVEKVIFPPRLIALTVFLLTVFLANKFICSWGCQLGVLQDLIFRLGRNNKDSGPGGLPQFKVPFVITNTVRVAFLAAFTIAAFAWGMELIEPIDPFRVYKPFTWTLLAGGFIIFLLVLSLFVYRPWCHFACPFGLVGWLVEKISLNRIKVDYESCIGCEACARACPSTVMEAILKREKTVIPDCFSCGTCMGVCPTDSISFGTGKRDMPPAGKFDGKGKAKEKVEE